MWFADFDMIGTGMMRVNYLTMMVRARFGRSS